MPQACQMARARHVGSRARIIAGVTRLCAVLGARNASYHVPPHTVGVLQWSIKREHERSRGLPLQCTRMGSVCVPRLSFLPEPNLCALWELVLCFWLPTPLEQWDCEVAKVKRKKGMPNSFEPTPPGGEEGARPANNGVGHDGACGVLAIEPRGRECTLEVLAGEGGTSPHGPKNFAGPGTPRWN